MHKDVGADLGARSGGIDPADLRGQLENARETRTVTQRSKAVGVSLEMPPLEGEYLPGRVPNTRVRKAPSKRGKGSRDHLTDAAIRAAMRAAIPGSKPVKLADGQSLYVLIRPDAAPSWRMKFRHGDKRKRKEGTYTIGAYPEISIAKARAERDRVRDWLRRGFNPVAQRRIEDARAAAVQAVTFAVIAEEYFAKMTTATKGKRPQWGPVTAGEKRRLYDRFVKHTIGPLPSTEVDTPAVLEALKAIERIDAHELLAKARVLISQVSRYAVATGRMKDDPTTTLRGAFVRPPVVNRPTVTDAELPQLFGALAAVPSEAVTKLAFYFQNVTAARPGEARFAMWGEIDGPLWKNAAEKMKMRHAHVVPLTPLALEILERAKAFRQTGEPDELIFPGFTRHGALSENAFTSLLARAGFYGRQTAHGMRAAFASWAHECGKFDPVAVELCLAHRPPGIAGDYNRALYLPQRKKILSAWSAHLLACGLTLP